MPSVGRVVSEIFLASARCVERYVLKRIANEVQKLPAVFALPGNRRIILGILSGDWLAAGARLGLSRELVLVISLLLVVPVKQEAEEAL
jgi:hypothetical protein